MKKQNKNLFSLPYAGIDAHQGLSIITGTGGEMSVIIAITNPALQYEADTQSYLSFQHLLLNVIKTLGEGYIIQKQDVFVRRNYRPAESEEYLQQKYQQHFRGRIYTDVKTYLTITRQVKKGLFYSFSEKQLASFTLAVTKAYELLVGGGLHPRILEKAQIERLINRVLAMDFVSPHPVLDNMRVDNRQIEIGEQPLRCLSLVDTDSFELPDQVAPYRSDALGAQISDFPVDNLSFLLQVPGHRTIIYNQLIEIPSQRATISKLQLKAKRHSGVPDHANLACVEDIDSLLAGVARDNQLIVRAHFGIVLSAEKEHIDSAANFIEASLFRRGIIPCRSAYNQLELFRTNLPGNAVELKTYDWFLTTADAALCLFFKESLPVSDPSEFLIHFTDRQGIPIGIDPADLPMQTGRINNRNKFVLGPSGSGKSFFMNALIQQYMLYNMDVVIVDTGHSYSGLCAYFGGRYVSWTDSSPITMNPFTIGKNEDNIEKQNYLVTLISVLWKGADGEVAPIERDIISSVTNSYYKTYFQHLENPNTAQIKLCFNSFYEHALERIPEIMEEEGVAFALNDFRFLLKKFYRGGEFQTILNEDTVSSLLKERFIVFEIDNVANHPILFPIVTLVMLDVVMQKMRQRLDRRKAFIVEEAWKAIASPLMAGQLLYLYKTARKFWGEAIVVTQELGDILGNATVKDSIISNSDTVCLLDQSKFKDNYQQIAGLLSIKTEEQRKIFTIGKLENKTARGRFKEVYIRRGTKGEVYGVEVSLTQYLAFTTEKPEKNAVEKYTSAYGNYKLGLEAFIADMQASALPLDQFVKKVNNQEPLTPIPELAESSHEK
ncbi:TraG family conjugative transposon ATPase [Sphingobacterium shayense]|uniref:TraG family conjugative transposon ATPase n=1 Tax=Sphingobacterium shayense TaxID=626343 RepID=UPI0015556516|nr:TraG family conjugative transposon ATPase [Sphingobacterium shayense]NQD70003.1 TraG family conjugative transposon ATPase [Sphingobacterium shayense]